MLAPDIDPVAIHLGPLKVHWYGLMYLVGFLGGWWLGIYRAKRPGSGWQPQEIADFLFYGALGVILGGRIGYVLFYNFGYYLAHPIEIFYIWTGGMSFHGGLLGVIIAMWLYARRTHRPFFVVADFVALLTPLGLGAGRLGNFINHELWGRVTDVPWGMIFPNAGPLPRHPSQLYEFTLEGVALFYDLVDFCPQAATRSVGFGHVFAVLRTIPFQCGIRARAGCSAWLSRLRLGDHGTNIEPADDSARHRVAVVGVQAARPPLSMS